MNFGQGLSSILHFRQHTLPNSESGEKLTPENARIPMNLRQGIASHRRKEMGQVTTTTRTTTRAACVAFLSSIESDRYQRRQFNADTEPLAGASG